MVGFYVRVPFPLCFESALDTDLIDGMYEFE